MCELLVWGAHGQVGIFVSLKMQLVQGLELNVSNNTHNNTLARCPHTKNAHILGSKMNEEQLISSNKHFLNFNLEMVLRVLQIYSIVVFHAPCQGPEGQRRC